MLTVAVFRHPRYCEIKSYEPDHEIKTPYLTTLLCLIGKRGEKTELTGRSPLTI
jgi:hypothetical protein